LVKIWPGVTTFAISTLPARPVVLLVMVPLKLVPFRALVVESKLLLLICDATCEAVNRLLEPI